MTKVKHFILAVIAFTVLAPFANAEEDASTPAAVAQDAAQTATPAQAPAIRYRISYTGADDFIALFKQHLEIEQLKNDPQMSSLQLDRLYEEAPEQIKSLLATEGYFNPKIQSRLRRTPTETIIQFNLTLGEPTRIQSVNIDFLGDITQQEANLQPNMNSLKQGWQLPVGSIFKQADWDKAKNQLLTETSQKRYAQAAIIDSEAIIDPDMNRATLNITIDSGAHYRMMPPIIEGLNKYPEKIIAENNTIQAGEDYDQKKILALQERLQQTGFFKTVEISPRFEDDTLDKTPLLISVNEKLSKLFNIGAGYSNNAGARGQIGYQDYNIFKQGWTWRNLLKLEKNNQSIESQILLRPRQNFRDSVGLKFTREQVSNNLLLTKADLNIARNWGDEKFNRLLRLKSSYIEYSRQVNNVTQHSNNYLTALGYSWIKRELADPLLANKGYVLHLHLDGAANKLLSNISFARAYAKADWYYPLNRRFDFKFRTELGAHWIGETNTNSDFDEKVILEDYLFKLGGDQTIRGYPNKSITLPGSVGANHMGLLSTEITYWFLDKWGVATFVDTGSIMDKLSNFKLYTGYGVGGRWRSPVGPFNFDVAYGDAIKKWHWHLSLGVAY